MVIRPDTVAARLGGLPGIQAFLKGSAVPALRGIGLVALNHAFFDVTGILLIAVNLANRLLGRYRRRLERKLVPGKVTFR